MVQIIGLEVLIEEAEVKVLLNENGIVFGNVKSEHKNLSNEEIRYSPDYPEKTNALAGFLSHMSKRIEFRKDQKFSEKRVRNIVESFYEEKLLLSIKDFSLYYVGKNLGKFGQLEKMEF